MSHILRRPGDEDKVLIVNTTKPRHVEEHTLLETADAQPWQIEFAVVMDPIDPRTHGVYFYARAKDVQKAYTLAFKAFEQWHKVEKSIIGPYPDATSAKLTVMDESEWDEVWACAKRHIHKFIGMIDNPSCFSIMEPVKV